MSDIVDIFLIQNTLNFDVADKKTLVQRSKNNWKYMYIYGIDQILIRFLIIKVVRIGYQISKVVK